ncbi:MAG: hypothetical protein WAO00_08405 [Chthoniobacterales bacterium]
MPLAPSETEPIVYAHIGVSAADNKSHTADDPKWATGRWGKRSGNEGRVGTPAKIYRVLRSTPPAPPAVDTSEKVWATRADYHSLSYYTFRWARNEKLKAHIFRALDDTLFQVDFSQRPRDPLDTGNQDLFPVATWTSTTKANIASALDKLNSLATPIEGDTDEVIAAKTKTARAAYGALSDNEWRTLAGLPGNEAAFSQLTYEPLDPDQAENADRAGPDGSDKYSPDEALRAYTAELDGRASNRYFFRAAYVNAALTVGALGPSSPPVYLFKVEPLRTPVMTKIFGGDRAITLTWAANREADLMEYRVYRTDDERKARDVRLMKLVATIPELHSDPALRTKDVMWTDTGVVALKTYHYRLAARNNAQNESAPSADSIGKAYDYGPPPEPTWERSEWVKLDATGVEHPYWEVAPGLLPVVALVFTTTQGNIAALMQRQNGTWRNISVWQRNPVHVASTDVWRFSFYDRSADLTVDQRYRGRLITTTGVCLDSVNEREVRAP